MGHRFPVNVTFCMSIKFYSTFRVFLSQVEMENFSDSAVLILTLISVVVFAWIRFVKTGPVYKCKTLLNGKTVLITGGNSGIGKATAIELAKRHARVIIACRSEVKSRKAVLDVKLESGNQSIRSMKLNLSDFDDVQRFSAEFMQTESSLDILVNNAGVKELGQNKDGLDLMLATNHLGPFLLTHLLMPLMKATSSTSPVRIVNVSSYGYILGNIDLENLSPEVSEYRQPWKQYGNTKLMNVYFTTELNKRLREDDPDCNGITTYSVHPGTTDTNLLLAYPGRIGIRSILREVAMFLFSRSVFYSCQTILFCCLEEGLESKSGSYFSDLKANKLWKHARDPELGQKLWEKSKKLTRLA